MLDPTQRRELESFRVIMETGLVPSEPLASPTREFSNGILPPIHLQQPI